MEPQEQLRKLSSILLDAMQARNLTLEKLATLTNISERFLEPLLTDEIKKLPSSPYLHGYIVKIGSVLGLDGEEIWNAYFSENADIRRSGKFDDLPKNRFKKRHIDRRIVFGGALGIIFLIFVIWRIQVYFGPPALSLAGFTDNMIVETPEYTLRGNVDVKHQLTLNGEQIYQEPNGDFEKEIALQPGWNALSFKIKKFLGSEYTMEKQIFLKTDETPAPRGAALENGRQESENNSTTTNSTTTQ